MIRLMIAEDQVMFRSAMRKLLELEPDMTVVAEVGRGDEVVDAAITHRPDIALVDIEMPGIDGLTAAALLRDALPSCRVLIVTTFGRPGFMQRALGSGAAGFVLKDAPSEVLADAIRRCAAGERVIDPSLAAAALQVGPSPLTVREREALAASASGASIAEIARTLHLSEGTIRNRISIVIRKLNARNRHDAARIAREYGWL
ncbi:MAG: response regulator [Candidatus Dormibacteria bacterium]